MFAALTAGLALAVAACGSDDSSSDTTGAAATTAAATDTTAAATDTTAAATDTTAAATDTTAAAETTAPVPAPEPVSLTLGTVSSITNLPVVLGQARGYFEDEGIDLTVEYMQSGVNIVPALASGQIDIGEGSVTPGTFNSFGRDIDAPVVSYKGGCAADFDFCPLVLSTSFAEEFTDWTSIKGKTIAISAKWTASHQKLVELDAQYGVDPSEYNLIELPFAEMTQALAGGAIDAAIMIEPTATAVESQGVGTRVLDGDHEPSVPVVFTSYSESLAEDTSATSAGVRYQKAVIRATLDIIAAREAFAAGDTAAWHEITELPLVAETYPVLADEATRDLVSVPLVRAEPYVTQDDFDTVRDFYLDGDQLTPEAEEITYDQLVNTTFVEQALAALG